MPCTVRSLQFWKPEFGRPGRREGGEEGREGGREEGKGGRKEGRLVSNLEINVSFFLPKKKKRGQI